MSHATSVFNLGGKAVDSASGRHVDAEEEHLGQEEHRLGHIRVVLVVVPAQHATRFRTIMDVRSDDPDYMRLYGAIHC